MSILSKALGAVGLKALSEMRFPGRSFVFFDFPRKDLNEMALEVGDGTTSDIVMTPVRWLQRAMNEANIAVFIDDEIAGNHALPALIENPNPFYAGDHLLAGTVYSLSTEGTAYWIKVKNGNGKLVELWWVPHHLIEPKWPDEGNVFISHYEYNVAGKKIRLEIKDVIVFRDGVDPQNMRKGLSPLRGLLREIWTDNEAAVFTAALLRNGGVPGIVISPDSDNFTITPEEAEQAKDKFQTEYTRERRGKPIVMTGRTKVEQFGFSPQQLDLSPLRDVSEERVTAALGVPAAVVGFGTGLQQTKVGATMRELRQLAWHNGVIPLQRIIAGSLTRSLLPEMGNQGRVGFDNSEVAALADDEDKHVERIARLVGAGVWTRAEARMETGQETTPADDVFLLPFTVMEVPRTGMPAARPNEPLPTDPEERARLDIERKEHSLLEHQIVESARRAKPSARVEAFAASIDVIRSALPAIMETELLTFFANLGEKAEAEARRVLVEERSAGQAEMKREHLIADRIAAGIDMLGIERALKALYEKHYLRVGELTGKELAKFLTLEVGLPDAAARALIATGGTRAGLLDLTAKTKRKIFDALVEGRIRGLAGDNLARFIREHVERGPWSSPAIRARVIARTETAFATNISVIEGARNITGVEMMMVLDARAGATDEICEAMNGRVVTLAEAEALAAAEHPSGTRSMAPITPQLAEEMGLLA